MTEPIQTEFLTPDQLATLLKRSTVTLRKMRRRGDGPKFAQLGSAILYARKDVLAWIKRNTRTKARGGKS